MFVHLSPLPIPKRGEAEAGLAFLPSSVACVFEAVLLNLVWGNRCREGSIVGTEVASDC
jgi:hypothetical protein